MKELFLSPEIEIIMLQKKDIVTASPNDEIVVDPDNGIVDTPFVPFPRG